MSIKIKTGARAVADVDQGRILASVEIASPAERVFQALTTSSDITSWWGSPEEYRTTAYEADVRPGGHWRADGVGADGHAFFVEGEFREVNPPHRLVQTWKAPWDGSNETTITYRLEPIEGGTRLTLRHEGFADRVESCRGHALGWERVLGWLGKYLKPAENQRYYMCRLLAPRPTFAADMNAEEASIMRAHSAYWRKLLEDGVAIVFGPVADPQGAWGLGVVRAPSPEDLQVLSAGDPAIQSGRGFRYEVLPMIQAVTRA
jgi:uncharacterized protein YndB with AHSA1/START domain/uncharacterized protein YciI